MLLKQRAPNVLAMRPDRAHRRLVVLGILLALALVVTLARFGYLALVPSSLRTRLLTQDLRQHSSTTVLATPRAAITDRHGRSLALTVMRPSIFIVPARLPDPIEPEGRALFDKIAQLSGVPRSRLVSWRNNGRQFAWLRRQTTEDIERAFAALPSWSEYGAVLKEPARVYPFGTVASQLIGFTGIDNHGLTGVEALYDAQIRGEQQSVQVTRDARRRLVVTWPNDASKPDTMPAPLVLSIDAEVQRILEGELAKAMKASGARGASGVIMDVTSGELYALASLPSFDGNRPETRSPESTRLRPLQDALELGSVIKPFVVAAALDAGSLRSKDHLDCENGVLRLPGGTINDVKKKGVLSVSDILKFSSNVCMYKIARGMGREQLWKYLQAFGLTEPAGTGLPGEFTGDRQDHRRWRELRFANISFGQGIAISPLQMTRAAATLVSGGARVPVRILRTDQAGADALLGPRPVFQVVQPEVSFQLRKMMAGIVTDTDATAPAARLMEFSAGGKTGTAQKFSSASRSYSERIPSFLGFFPAELPRFAVYIVLDEVSVRPAWGGTLAAPVFSAVGTALGRYLKATGHLSLYNSDPLNSERP
jgi:cell division protein FtsI (penicillin-binding protein 3)